ncbi:MAG: PQQ-binding-like beta-propeller repeat protein [Chitinivibrionales bacterium]|nr:PQQ-binding-like beta-propeller repeat protein [Chitinivibrionales bacterium]
MVLSTGINGQCRFLRNMRIDVLAVIVLLGTVSANADWPTFRGNRHRTAFVNESLGLPADSTEWIVRLSAPVSSSPSVSNGVVYTGCHDSMFYALNCSTGQAQWSKKTDGLLLSSPLVVGDTVVVPCSGGRIYFFDAHQADTLKTLPGASQLLSSPGISDGGDLMIGMGTLNRFSVLPHMDGALEWSLYLTQACHSSAASSGNRAIIAASDKSVYCLDLESPRVIWHANVQGDPYMSTPAIANSTVFFASGDTGGSVYAMNLADGSVQWRSTANTALSKPAVGTHAFSSPAVARYTSSVAVDSHSVYVVFHDVSDTGVTDACFSLVCLDVRDGSERWRFTEDAPRGKEAFNSSPAVTNDYVFFGWSGGKAYALGTHTGSKQWEDVLQGGIIASPAIAGNRLYFATMEGYMYCYALTETPGGIDFRQSTFCYPNPAPGQSRRMVSKIQVYAPRAAAMEMTIYNTADKPVARVSRSMGADEKYTHEWDISRVSNGVYFARIRVKYREGGEERKTVKIAILK